MLPDGSVIIHVGVQNHGQGHETTLAQIAAHELTHRSRPHLDPLRRYGDQPLWVRHVRVALDRVCRRRGGEVVPDAGREDPARSARICCRPTSPTPASRAARCTAPPARSASTRSRSSRMSRQEQLPTGMEPLLEAIGTYEPTVSGGVFAYGTHAVVVAVDPDSGVVELLDYVVAEDCGTMINPMIVDGQVQGGIAQGIGTALYEEIPYDELGQPLATTFADYMVPCAPEIPDVRLAHLVSPAHGDRIRRQGPGRGRRHRAAGGDRECRRRRVPQHRRELQRDAADAAPRVGGDRPRAPRARALPHEIGALRLRAAEDGGRGERAAGAGWRRRPPRLPAASRSIPMLNLRAAQVDLLVDLSRLDELKAVSETPRALQIGALTTHAAIEDGKIPDRFDGLMRRVAGTISYRAVRNHGTIGGSVALADPAADWPGCLIALGATVRIAGRNGTRQQPVADFVQGLYSTSLASRRDHSRLRRAAPGRAAALGLCQGRAQERRLRQFDRVRGGAGARTVRSPSCSPPQDRARSFSTSAARQLANGTDPRTRCAPPLPTISRRICRTPTPTSIDCTPRRSCGPQERCGRNHEDHADAQRHARSSTTSSRGRRWPTSCAIAAA